LKEISLVHLDATHCAYQITFHDSATSNSYLIIPVLLSGKAIAPKPEPTPKTQE
jgi:hypothetical protein